MHILGRVKRPKNSRRMKQLCGTATKKPVKIHWFKWRGHSESHIHELEAWIESLGENFKDVIDLSQGKPRVLTLEGISYELPNGYIIIRGIQGEYYPIDSKIFSETYNII